MEGSNALFTTLVTSTHPVQVTWYMDRKEVTPSSRVTVAESGMSHELFINRCRQWESGPVHVEARNKFGSATQMAQLTVSGWVRPRNFNLNMRNMICALRLHHVHVCLTMFYSCIYLDISSWAEASTKALLPGKHATYKSKDVYLPLNTGVYGFGTFRRHTPAILSSIVENRYAIDLRTYDVSSNAVTAHRTKGKNN